MSPITIKSYDKDTETFTCAGPDGLPRRVDRVTFSDLGILFPYDSDPTQLVGKVITVGPSADEVG